MLKFLSFNLSYGKRHETHMDAAIGVTIIMSRKGPRDHPVCELLT
jgi:hypothetical protein